MTHGRKPRLMPSRRSSDIDRRLSQFTLYEGIAQDPKPGPRPGCLVILGIGLIGLISPFVAIGMIGGAALQRVFTSGRRPRSERICDVLALVVTAVAFVAHPYLEALRTAQLEDARALVEAIIEGRQLDLRVPRPPAEILIDMVAPDRIGNDVAI